MNLHFEKNVQESSNNNPPSVFKRENLGMSWITRFIFKYYFNPPQPHEVKFHFLRMIKLLNNNPLSVFNKLC